MSVHQQFHPLFQDGHRLRVGYRGKIIDKVIHGMPTGEVIQQRFDRNTRPNENRGSPKNVGIAVYDDALIFHMNSSKSP